MDPRAPTRASSTRLTMTAHSDHAIRFDPVVDELACIVMADM